MNPQAGTCALAAPPLAVCNGAQARCDAFAGIWPGRGNFFRFKRGLAGHFCARAWWHGRVCAPLARVPREYNNRASRTLRTAWPTTPRHNLRLKCGAFRLASSRCSYLPRPHLPTSHARQHGRLVVGRTGTRTAAAPLDPVARRLGLRGQPLLHLPAAAARLGRRRVQHDSAECVVCQSGISGSVRVRRSCGAWQRQLQGRPG